MLKSQIVIVIISAIAVFGLFRLPKVIVSSEETPSTKETPMADSHQEDMPHKAILSEEERQKAISLTEQYNNFSDKEKKYIFADSLARFYMKNFMFDSSAKYYERASELKPGKENFVAAGQAYYDAFTLSQNREMNKKAASMFEKALAVDPKDNEVKANYALTFVTTETPMKGINLLREILEEDPAHETALYNMGLLAIQSGQHEKAIERFGQIVKNNPVHPNAHFYIGMCYANLGNKTKALEHLEKAKGNNQDPAFLATIEQFAKDLK
ncbi:MAG: tetratricopeptide repeat protein [Cytophagaceae bacterium]